MYQIFAVTEEGLSKTPVREEPFATLGEAARHKMKLGDGYKIQPVGEQVERTYLDLDELKKQLEACLPISEKLEVLRTVDAGHTEQDIVVVIERPSRTEYRCCTIWPTGLVYKPTPAMKEAGIVTKHDKLDFEKLAEKGRITA
jgi:hypothetical protein